MKRVLILFLAILLSGCASLLTAYTERSTRKEPVVVGDDKGFPPVAGVSLSSSRRLILSSDKSRKEQNYYTCSEPAPDTALNQALQSAFAASAKSSTDKEAHLNASDTVVLTNIVLSTRTELVELWRTTSFQYCQFMMNGDIKAANAYLAAAQQAINKVGVAAASNGQAALQTAAAQNIIKQPVVNAPGDGSAIVTPAQPAAPVPPK